MYQFYNNRTRDFPGSDRRTYERMSHTVHPIRVAFMEAALKTFQLNKRFGYLFELIATMATRNKQSENNYSWFRKKFIKQLIYGLGKKLIKQ